MAEHAEHAEQNGSHLSVVPYDNNREVVLRHAESVVVLDPTSRQLILRSQNQDLEKPDNDPNCPTCGRPYDRNDSSAIDDDFPDERPSFINSEYFRMLASSHPGSNRSSRPPSPHRQLAQRGRSPLIQEPLIPPPEAEFVGSAPAPLDGTHGISESAFAPGYFERFFKIERELGRGGRGVVLLVKHVLDHVTLGHFACKRVPVGDDHGWLEKVLVEVQLLQKLSHQNLVSYRHVWLEDYQINPFSPSIPCAFILQQYCNGGDLHSYVCASAQVKSTMQDLKERIRRKSRGEADAPRKLNEARKLHFDQIYSFFLDITEGLRFLHLNGFIHRDLKPSNCLIDNIGGETRVLVSDFGEVQYENSIRKSTGATGTISYCAPEVLRPISPGGPLGNFTFKSDIFSLGMILHFLCFANLPYINANVLHEEREDLEALKAEISGWLGFDERRRQRPDLPNKLYAVLKHLLSLDPDNRPTSDEIRNILKSGNAEFIPEMKRRPSATEAEELTPGRRITRIDSPAPLIADVAKPNGKDKETMSPAPHMRRRPGSSRSPPLDASYPAPVAGIGGPSNKAVSKHDNPSALNALAMRRSSSNTIHQPSRLARPQAHVSGSPPPQSPLDERTRPVRKQQYLLPAPEPKNTWQMVRSTLATPITSLRVPILSFLFKIFTTIQPCLSHGMKSNNFFFGVFIVAAGELASYPHPVWRVLLLAMLHVLMLWYAKEHDLWCRTNWVLAD